MRQQCVNSASIVRQQQIQRSVDTCVNSRISGVLTHMSASTVDMSASTLIQRACYRRRVAYISPPSANRLDSALRIRGRPCRITNLGLHDAHRRQLRDRDDSPKRAAFVGRRQCWPRTMSSAQHGIFERPDHRPWGTAIARQRGATRGHRPQRRRREGQKQLQSPPPPPCEIARLDGRSARNAIGPPCHVHTWLI